MSDDKKIQVPPKTSGLTGDTKPEDSHMTDEPEIKPMDSHMTSEPKIKPLDSHMTGADPR